jgi:hypothetical protein
MISSDRIHRIVDGVHLVYLGLLPALATYAVLSAYGHPAMFLVFFGGIVAVSVYLAVVASYTPPSTSLPLAFLTLVDGPLCAALAQPAGGGPAAFAINGFLVDGLAIWLAIVWLAVTTSRPTKGQRAATLFLTLVAVAAVVSVLMPYLREVIVGEWRAQLWLGVGIIEGVIARHTLLKADQVVRTEGVSARFIVVLLFLWIGALIAGNVLYEVSQ